MVELDRNNESSIVVHHMRIFFFWCHMIHITVCARACVCVNGGCSYGLSSPERSFNLNEDSSHNIENQTSNHLNVGASSSPSRMERDGLLFLVEDSLGKGRVLCLCVCTKGLQGCKDRPNGWNFETTILTHQTLPLQPNGWKFASRSTSTP